MKNTAVFTIVRNEDVFLNLWCKYYTKFNFDVYVIDNSSNDGSVEKAKIKFPNINIAVAPNKLSFDHLFLKNTVSAMQEWLLQQYKVVIFAEADEFLIPCNNVKLDEYVNEFLNSNNDWAKTAWGVNIVHDFENEKPIMFENCLSILENRNLAYTYTGRKGKPPSYDKTLICKKPAKWSIGFHRADDSPPVDNNLALLHLQQVDIDLYCNRRAQRNKIPTNELYHGSDIRKEVEMYFKTGIPSFPPKFNQYDKKIEILQFWKEQLTFTIV